MHLFGNKDLSKALARSASGGGGGGGGGVFVQHAQALLRVLGHAAIPLLLQHCQERAVDMMRGGVIPYVQVAKVGVPRDLKLPSAQLYGIDGVQGYFTAKLVDLEGYPKLEDGMLQAFRETGNILAFTATLDQALAQVRSEAS
eukprot:CAMPEP_0206255414 /NCGR_PEP_ID=MMETSP0047_2-20121206/24234_1 /ASSEMBLY_ACC=CAM_ASM_000192 /TAXON_ID=195065 /ORGANISM="Chroomonas mesostigmatica_cf, Strain CCMP1168" /LENGTH=142 /DNA_ID=CAMNT_0053681811 /DNA_START=105 /DNA_END=531 /DNA_ORIENTATION=-